jgi:uncharacterized protein
MKPSLTDSLCTRCGLCCDGSLFSDVELSNGEGSALEGFGMDIEDDDDDGELLIQPCGALKGKRCSIYAHRPNCCRTFECRLLQDVKRGKISIDQAKETVANALGQIQMMKGMIGQLSGKEDDEGLPLKERFVDALALSEDSSSGPDVHQRWIQLEKAMSSFENFIHATFLGN